MINSLFH